MRPFPRANPDEVVRQRLWEDYRQDLISAAGICLVVLGNKRVDGQIVSASGVRREYEIARQHGLNVVPLGATGYMANEIWSEMSSTFDAHYPNAKADLREQFSRLGEAVEKPAELISRTLEFVGLISKE